MSKNLIKVIGMATTLLTIGTTLITIWVNDKNMDEKIAQKVSEALSKKM